jgi:hypothetical protein
MTTLDPITVGTRVVISKGCKAREVTKGATAVIKAVEALGADYSHAVKVTLWFQNSFLAGKTLSFTARHMNRLSDPIIGMNDGNPLHRIEIRRK